MKVLASAERNRSRQQRAPRFEINCPAQIAADGEVGEATILDISEGGIKIEAASAAVGAQVVVALAGLSKMRGRIVWAQEGTAGVAFEERFCFETLSRWCAEHRVAARATRALVGPMMAMLASPATAADPAQGSDRTYASVEILDPVGVSVEAKLDKNGAVVGTASARSSFSADVVVSTTKTASSGSARRGSGGAVLQYN